MHAIDQALEQEFRASLATLLAHHQLSGIKRRLLIGCSGGADSLALTLLCHHAKGALGYEFHVCVVDHGLRENSAREAKQTVDWLYHQGIDVHLRTLLHKPSGNLQNFARTHRRQLLCECALAQNCDGVLLAHHRRDQAETVLDRLARGSHVVGLSGMQPLSFWQDMALIRPLLQVSPERLRHYALQHQAPIVDDPSNQQHQFRRVQIRLLLQDRPQLEAQALRIAENARFPAGVELAAARACWRQHISIPFQGIIALDLTGWQHIPSMVAHRTLGAAISYVSGTSYPPRYAKIRALQNRLCSQAKLSLTLGKVKIRTHENRVWFSAEFHAPVQYLSANTHIIWNPHWHVSNPTEYPLKLHPLGRAGWLRKMPMHPQIAFLGDAFPRLSNKTTEITPLGNEKYTEKFFTFQPLRKPSGNLLKTGLYFDHDYPIS